MSHFSLFVKFKIINLKKRKIYRLIRYTENYGFLFIFFFRNYLGV